MKKITTQSIALLLMLSISSFFACKKDKTPVAETVTDIQGNVYKTVKIGTQTWMAENLKTTKLNDGTSIPFISSNATWSDPNNTSPMACAYENNIENLNTYGVLYNWYAVETGKLAPVGWRVANTADWDELAQYLTNNGYDYNGTIGEGTIAKSVASTAGWNADNTAGNVGNDPVSNNKSGFGALPGGSRSSGDGSFQFIGSYGGFWLFNIDGPSGSTLRYNFNYPTIFEASLGGHNQGRYIRCVKD